MVSIIAGMRLWWRLMRVILQVFFRLLYHELAFTYDAVSWLVSMGQWRAWQRCGLAFLPPGGRVLEVAHGPGHMLAELRQRGYAVTGIDLSPQMGALARRAQTPLARARVQNLPFEDNTFASILSTFPTEFMVDEAALRELWRVAQPGGVAVFVPVAHITGPAWPDRLAALVFALTGQASQAWFEPVLARFAQAGWQARVEQVTLPRSVVTVIVAARSAPA